MKTFLKLILLFFAFALSFVLPAVLLPLRVTVTSQSEYNAPLFILLLLVDFFILLYLIKHLSLSGMRLFLALVIIFWGLQTFMTQIETWYFIDAMPAITSEELRNLFLRPLITSILFIPLAIWGMDKWKQDHNSSEDKTQPGLTWQHVLWLSVAYVIIYFVFGYFVAWQFEAVRIFYSGNSQDVGFMEQLNQTIQTKHFIFPFQLLRGALWILMGLPMLMYFKGTKTEKIFLCVTLYALLPAIQLVVDNPFMPPHVRLAHLIEVSTSNGLFGFLIGYVSTRKS